MLHEHIPLNQVHGAINWEVANEAARDALTLLETDLYKLCYQLDNLGIYLLVDWEAPTWTHLNPATSEIPLFQASKGSAQNTVAGGYQKIVISTEVADTHACYDTGNSRFTPSVAGWYQFNAVVNVSAALTSLSVIMFYKNGAEARRGTGYNSSSYAHAVSALIYCNGTTDYVELWLYSSNVVAIATGVANTSWEGSLVRPD